MKKLMLLILCLLVLTVFGSEFLMLYPNGLTMKGDTIAIQTETVHLDVPNSWIVDSFTSDPYPKTYQHVIQESFDYGNSIKKAVGG